MSAGARTGKDLAAGLLFITIAASGAWVGRSLTFGTAAEMGEGFLPLVMCGFLGIIGVATCARALVRGDEALPGWRLKPLLWVTLAVVAFALAIEPLGLVLAVALVLLFGNFAGRPMGAGQLALFMVILSIAVVAGFVYGLKLVIPVWPPALV